jgi:hypothetical protein
MHEFVFIVVTFGGHEMNHVTGQRRPDYCSMLILVLVVLFFDFPSSKCGATSGNCGPIFTRLAKWFSSIFPRHCS